MSPVGQGLWTLRPQLVMLFRRLWVLLRKDLTGIVIYQGWALRFHRTVPLHASTLPPEYICNVTHCPSFLLLSLLPCMMDYVLLNCKSNWLSIPKVASCQVFNYSNKKKGTITDIHSQHWWWQQKLHDCGLKLDTPIENRDQINNQPRDPACCTRERRQWEAISCPYYTNI